uniref:Fatty acid hydroxylase domain-containing protein n=1 Tax=Entomoneis paludosa TaxID=265537 RepID=A0A7S3DQ26_9STRA|mmetsp:Transcript_2662/g.5416  ORF Transcript_2662/g.5416 Transcript_2662/m.5416 type:complete len:448 (+) Transcript_2662:143-1486(+)|eukprot:CAMPEP_0172463376 /NCGR_PEP_ID=MMETSP1065-20121228/46937_1 /TAXON_ID=265537 /ORGANISM="Amphiprora paludosa, Strain CCMP125" /LENGTH=447 /DNA_ID=CAMNT_0013219301 /DNA_START=83 /DNA_END=1426 /DNA_ORIENTATION=-
MKITAAAKLLAALLAVLADTTHGFSFDNHAVSSGRSALVSRGKSQPLFHPSNAIKTEPCLKRTSLTTATFANDAGSPLSGRRVPSMAVPFQKFWKNLRFNPVWHWRIVFGAFFASLMVFRQYLDNHVLVTFWNYLLTSQALPARIFRTDSWEWCWAITCFSVYIHAFGWADRAVRKADEEGRVHPFKKYRLQDRYMADQQRRSRFSTRDTNSQQVQLLDQGKDNDLVKPKHSKWNWQAWVGEFWIYAAPLLIWDIVAPRRHRRIGGFAPPTTMGILGGIAGGLFLYDIMFFCGHALMHKIPWLYRTVHSKHHITKEVRACEIVRLSISEEVLEVGFSIIALNLLSVHPMARTIYNMIITFLLTELHCGFDFPWTPQNVVPFGLATGSRRHHYHHRIGKHYYQKFFFHVDRLFGFFQKDDGSLDGDSVKKDPFIPKSWQDPSQPAFAT